MNCDIESDGLAQTLARRAVRDYSIAIGRAMYRGKVEEEVSWEMPSADRTDGRTNAVAARTPHRLPNVNIAMVVVLRSTAEQRRYRATSMRNGDRHAPRAVAYVFSID